MAKPLIQGVDCVRVYVTSLQSGLLFYRDRLGLELIWQTDHQAGLRLPDGDTELVLHTQQQGLEVDFKVKSADDAAIRVEEAGGTIMVAPFDIQIGRCVVVQDPWGNELVLLDTTKGLLQVDTKGNVIGNKPPE